MTGHSIRAPRFRFLVLGACLTAFAGCVTSPTAPSAAAQKSVAAKPLEEARSTRTAVEERAGLYLEAAAAAAPQLGSGVADTPSREAYDAACAELAVLLRQSNDGQLWNRPLTTTAGGVTYHLRFQPGNKAGIWAPDYFTAFRAASTVPNKTIKRRDRQDGVGGALVGVRKKIPGEPFAPLVGVTAPVTATLDFTGHDATLTLHDPSTRPNAVVAGRARPLAADFSAPLAYYPAVNEMWLGLMGAMHASHYLGPTGLYMVQPYDPNRIPLIFVHGLISTPQMWRNVANELEMDPVLRGHFQCWVFAYPTGNPYAYSALRFREELEKARQTYGWPHGIILVGHSMGGMVSHMQAITLTRADWDRAMGAPAEKLLARLPAGGLIQRCVIFKANPDVKRIIFICAPHRGAEMATGWIGEIAMRLISLPATLAGDFSKVLGHDAAFATGNSKMMPNGITCLSPNNPTLKVMNSVPIRAPYHTIFGDRGIHNEPNSTDGVVPYWSSHLDGALSEKSVPGPHGSCELPGTIEELKRILKLHLQTQAL